MPLPGSGSERHVPRSHEELVRRTDELLEELAGLNQQGTPLIVEGPRDEEALRGMGFTGPIVKLNTGESVLATVEGLAREQNAPIQNFEACRLGPAKPPGFIILVDWDRTGGRLARRLKEAAQACDLAAEDTFHRKLKALTGAHISCVEELPSFLELNGPPPL